MGELVAAVPPALLGAYAALLGATVGSFLNVVIARVPAGESVVRPRSRCPRCRQPIAWYDNLPVVSWLLLRGRCRGCALPISLRYPVVELLGGGLAWLAFHRRGFTLAALAEFAFSAILLALAAIDLDTWLLPNALTWPLIVLGLVAGAFGLSAAPSLAAAAWGAGLGFGGFFLVAWLGEKVLGKEALGFGDVWLLAGLGAWMGGRALLPMVLLASTQGALVGVALILLGRAQPGPERGGLEPSPTPIPGPNSDPIPGPAATADPTTDPTPSTDPKTTAAPTTDAAPSAAPAPSTDPTPAPTASAEPAPDPDPLLAEPDPGVDDWVPPRNAVPFGPFLVAGALEWLWFSGALARAFPLLGVFR